MKCSFAAMLVALSLGATFPAQAGLAEDVRAVYDQFAEAQNAHDLAKVKTFLVDSPKFLWVSDGMSFWGPDALVNRMAEFQLAEVWYVDPDLAAAAIVEVDDGAAYVHMPLALTIELKAKPDVIPFPRQHSLRETGQGLAHRSAIHNNGDIKVNCTRARRNRQSKRRAQSVRRNRLTLSHRAFLAMGARKAKVNLQSRRGVLRCSHSQR